ncbi:MAG TPA: endonuclease MutS2 [Dehalococcoidia bacterium]|nr:endonuclease MutS2 [Dehalococcoidia bacterium]
MRSAAQATRAVLETPLDDKALETLEFPAILDRLASLTAFSAGRERAGALRPASDRATVVLRQRETAEAVFLESHSIALRLDGCHDIRSRAEGAALGHVLAASDLLDVANTARAAQRVRTSLTRLSADVPLLATLAGGIAELGALRGLIEDSIDDRGEVVDDASPELRSIRRELNVAHERLQQRMQSLLNSADTRAALQDAIVTIRDGRYVLPVRSEARGVVQGVIHDTSASGATVYVEPLAVVELGNRWRELQVQERHEVNRILREVSSAVGEATEDLVDAVDRLARIDVARAKGYLAQALDAQQLAVVGSQPWLVDLPAELRLEGARHPLLEGDVVPVSIEVGGEHRAVVITGPNTGGKTVALKTAGLLCAMALAGLPIPAEAGSRVPVYSSIFADIGDEQSIEQSLSTFSGHITSIIDVIERAGPGSLVLLDELGAGTDPTEGAALGIALIDRLIAGGATLIATTHHSELKLYAHQTDGVVNASVEFDVETLSPTYRLTIGLPGQSNALAIAARLGMPPDVIESAREGLSSEERDLESLLGDLRTQQAAAEERAGRAATARDEAETLRSDLQRQHDELAAETAQLREDAHRELRGELREVERLLQRTRRDVEAARLEQASADLDLARSAAEEIPPEPAAPPPPRERVEARDIAVGVAVWLRGIGSPGDVLSAPNEDGEFEVLLGALRARVGIDQVDRVGTATAPQQVARGATAAPPAPASAPQEVEVRGRTIDEALPVVEQFLDHAARVGHARVRVIHGRGTGTLRRAVRELFDRHPLVTSYETAEPREGGEGVTVAFLAGIQRTTQAGS